MSRLAVRERITFIQSSYRRLSACARSARTAGPFDVLSILSLDERPVGVASLFAPQCVHLTRQLPLTDAPDGRVAGHQRDVVKVQRDHRGAATHPGSCESRLATGVTAADDHDIVGPRVLPRTRMSFCRYRAHAPHPCRCSSAPRERSAMGRPNDRAISRAARTPDERLVAVILRLPPIAPRPRPAPALRRTPFCRCR